MGTGRQMALLLVACVLVFGRPGVAAAQAQTPPVGASARVLDASARVIAEATFREAPDQVLISLAFADRSALVGRHAIHIHEVGRCDPPDFTSAGGIFNPFGSEHGLKNPNGPMAGDLPSLIIGPSGVSSYNTSAPLVRLRPGPASLIRAAGTSLVIFAQADDDQTQPVGNAGARIACGVIQPEGPNATGILGALGLGVTRAEQSSSSGSPDLLTAVLIAALGTLLISAGVALRRARD